MLDLIAQLSLTPATASALAGIGGALLAGGAVWGANRTVVQSLKSWRPQVDTALSTIAAAQARTAEATAAGLARLSAQTEAIHEDVGKLAAWKSDTVTDTLTDHEARISVTERTCRMHHGSPSSAGVPRVLVDPSKRGG